MGESLYGRFGCGRKRGESRRKIVWGAVQGALFTMGRLIVRGRRGKMGLTQYGSLRGGRGKEGEGKTAGGRGGRRD